LQHRDGRQPGIDGRENFPSTISSIQPDPEPPRRPQPATIQAALTELTAQDETRIGRSPASGAHTVG
jgi:hypothetical protein